MILDQIFINMQNKMEQDQADIASYLNNALFEEIEQGGIAAAQTLLPFPTPRFVLSLLFFKI